MVPVSTTELTVIVTAHNREDLVEETLASLAEQEWDGTWDVLLVDNASTDHTADVLERWADKMPVPARILHADDRPNICYVRNTAVDVVDATSIVFVDDDDLLGPGFVAAMGDALRTHEFVGANRDLALLNDEHEAAWRGGADRNERTIIFGVPLIPGGGCGSRRELWQRLGGNDETLGYGAEDVGLSIEAHLAGVDIVFVDDAPYHVRLRTEARPAFRQAKIFGEAHVTLAQRYGDRLDVERLTIGQFLRAWAGMVRRLPMVFDPRRRPMWTWQLGRRVGRLTGSAKRRTWYP